MEESNMRPSSSTNVPDDGPSQHPSSLNSLLPPTQDSKEVQHMVGTPGVIHSCYGHTRSRTYATSFTEASSSSNSHTLIDDELNEAMAETWSAPTYAGSEHEADEPCFVLAEPRFPAEPAAYQNSHTTAHTLTDDRAVGCTTESYCASTLPESAHQEADQPSGSLESIDLVISDAHQPSSTSSCTLVDTRQDTSVESWSGSTLADSMIEESLADLYEEITLEQVTAYETALVAKKSGLPPVPPSGAISGGCSTPQGSLGRLPNVSTSDWQVVAKDGTRFTRPSFMHQPSISEAFKRFLAEDPAEAPWTVYHLRVSAT